MQWQWRVLTVSLTGLIGFVSTAQAHVSFLKDTNAYEGKSYVATLQIPHGCTHAVNGDHSDTVKVEVSIPDNFLNVKPADSVFGAATITRDASDRVTHITWTKSQAAEEDYLYNQVVFRGTPALGAAFSSLEFVTVQTCESGDTVAWEGSTVPKLKVYPARALGWNTYTASSNLDVTALRTYFSDAYIVWYNDAAYSANAVTNGLINTPLTDIPAGGEFWVKY
ncbi:MAG: DUF1775 domain-containing protein [Gammaproteobacteria bacterium]